MGRLRILLLMVFASVFLSGRAQIYYERWIDNNRGAMTRGSLILGEQSIAVDVSSIKWPGLHFLNIVPYDESGEMGVWRCIPFLMPEDWPGTTDAKTLEYWVTGYDSKPKRQAYDGTAVTLDIDASKYSAGLHFLNVRTMNSTGEGGAWNVIPFLMPEGWPGTTEAKTVEYWVTGYDSTPKRMAYTGATVTLDIDISQMSYGLHFLNFRTFNERGEPGAWKQMLFYISNFIFDEEETEYEYWIDQGEVMTGRGYFPGMVDIQIDYSALPAGEHTLNFRAKNNFGAYGDVYTIKFDPSKLFMTGDVNRDGEVGIGDIVAITNVMAGITSDGEIVARADVNGDGEVGIGDIVAITNIMAGR